MTLRHLLLMPMNKILDWKDHQIYSKMLRSVAIYVKRKSNISFSTKKSSFDQHFLMVKTFLKIIWRRFLVSHSEHLVSRSRKTQNILTLPMLLYYNSILFIAFFWYVSRLFTAWLLGLFSSIINVLSVSEHNFFILKFHCFMLLLNFITSKYSFFRRII